MGRTSQGLRKLSADLIDKASYETATQVVRIMLTFVGTAAFCLLSLESPDVGLLTSNEKLTVPFVGPVSFFGFILLGPAVLIVLRVYLQIYVEHSDRLNRVAQRMPVVRAPTLVPLKNPLIRAFSGLAFYLLLPVTMLPFAWKAAVFAPWGSGLLCVAAGVVAGHAMLSLRRVSWRTRALLSVGVAILAVGAMLPFGGFGPDSPLRRPFELSRANLSAASLQGHDLRGANLSNANLTGANLSNANLTHTDLTDADLTHTGFTGANLRSANLTGADVSGADVTGANLDSAMASAQRSADLRGANLTSADASNANLSANLTGANLSNANLTHADLSGADLTHTGLTGANLHSPLLMQEQLDGACGEGTELPPGPNPEALPAI
jgi:hypothetical protein